MRNTPLLDLELDAIDWDAPTGFPPEEHDNQTAADKHPALYEFIGEMAELIPEELASRPPPQYERKPQQEIGVAPPKLRE